MNILEQSYKNPIITEATIENMKRYPQFYTEASVKTQMGKIYTNDEFSRRSDEILSKELPSEKTYIKKAICNQ